MIKHNANLLQTKRKPIANTVLTSSPPLADLMQTHCKHCDEGILSLSPPRQHIHTSMSGQSMHGPGGKERRRSFALPYPCHRRHRARRPCCARSTVIHARKHTTHTRARNQHACAHTQHARAPAQDKCTHLDALLSLELSSASSSSSLLRTRAHTCARTHARAHMRACERARARHPYVLSKKMRPRTARAPTQTHRDTPRCAPFLGLPTPFGLGSVVVGFIVIVAPARTHQIYARAPACSEAINTHARTHSTRAHPHNTNTYSATHLDVLLSFDLPPRSEVSSSASSSSSLLRARARARTWRHTRTRERARAPRACILQKKTPTHARANTNTHTSMRSFP